MRGGGEWGREFILPQAFLWPPELTREGRKRDREKWREEKFELLLWYWNVSVGYDSCAAKYNSGEDYIYILAQTTSIAFIFLRYCLLH